MARTVVMGVCPSCFKERELVDFSFGTVRGTLCPHCLVRYFEKCVIPRLKTSNDTASDVIHSEVLNLMSKGD